MSLTQPPMANAGVMTLGNKYFEGGGLLNQAPAAGNAGALSKDFFKNDLAEAMQKSPIDAFGSKLDQYVKISPDQTVGEGGIGKSESIKMPRVAGSPNGGASKEFGASVHGGGLGGSSF